MPQDDISPIEQLVEAAAPESMRLGRAGADLDDEGEAIRPWMPPGEAALGAPPKKTVEGVGLTHSPRPPETAGGAPPSVKKMFGRWSKDDG